MGCGPWCGLERLTLDGDHELGEVAVADDPSELLLADEHAGGGPAAAHVAVAPALDVALGVPDGLDHRLPRVRRARRLGELPADPEPDQRERLGQALAQQRRGVW